MISQSIVDFILVHCLLVMILMITELRMHSYDTNITKIRVKSCFRSNRQLVMFVIKNVVISMKQIVHVNMDSL